MLSYFCLDGSCRNLLMTAYNRFLLVLSCYIANNKNVNVCTTFYVTVSLVMFFPFLLICQQDKNERFKNIV